MLHDRDIYKSLDILNNANLDVRTVTLGISLFDCVSHDIDILTSNIQKKIRHHARDLVPICNKIGNKYGIDVVNKRISISPVAVIAAPFQEKDIVKIAKALDSVAQEVGVDFIGGFSALVEKGMTPSDKALIRAIPEAMSVTDRICASVNVASTREGINMDAVNMMAASIKQAAGKTADRDGLACAKICVFSNIPPDMPFMAGAYLGVGEPDVVINVGVSGPGVVKNEIENAVASKKDSLDLGKLAELIKTTASLAPTPTVGDSVGEIFQSLGLESIGLPGSTALLAMLNDAVKKGGAFASSHVGGLSGAFIPVSEDLNIAHAAETGLLSIEKLEAMTAVCSVGLDMVAIPGDTSEQVLAGIIADEMAIGMINSKTTATRIIPVPGKKAGDKAFFGGLLGHATIIDVKNRTGENAFVAFGGRIPAPIHSLKN